MEKSQQKISAQVVLKSAADGLPDAAVTAANINELLPAAKDFEQVAKEFHDLGFEIGPAGGTGFSITAATSVFEKVFKVKIVGDASKGLQSKWSNDAIKDELPVSKLSKSTNDLVKTVVFSPPLDFGPGSY